MKSFWKELVDIYSIQEPNCQTLALVDADKYYSLKKLSVNIKDIIIII